MKIFQLSGVIALLIVVLNIFTNILPNEIFGYNPIAIALVLMGINIVGILLALRRTIIALRAINFLAPDLLSVQGVVQTDIQLIKCELI